tara:strand:- start:5233 stop:5364 length:132 start_codon:yes stop_codon:yes gene_type:complete
LNQVWGLELVYIVYMPLIHRRWTGITLQRRINKINYLSTYRKA